MTTQMECDREQEQKKKKKQALNLLSTFISVVKYIIKNML